MCSLRKSFLFKTEDELTRKTGFTKKNGLPLENSLYLLFIFSEFEIFLKAHLFPKYVRAPPGTQILAPSELATSSTTVRHHILCDTSYFVRSSDLLESRRAMQIGHRTILYFPMLLPFLFKLIPQFTKSKLFYKLVSQITYNILNLILPIKSRNNSICY